MSALPFTPFAPSFPAAIDADDAPHPSPAAPSAPPALRGRHVELRAIHSGDYPFLYQLATSEEGSWRWRHRGATPSPEQFASQLWQQVLSQFLIVTRDGERVGHLSAYGANFQHGYCYLTALAAPSAERTGLVMEAAALFLEHVFSTWAVRKVMIEAVAFHYDQFRSGAGRYFEVEGHLKEHEYRRGRYWDSYLLAITRARWAESARRILPLIVRPGGA